MDNDLLKKIIKLNNNIIDINILNEWIKWLEYKPDFETKKINSLNKKKVKDLSITDLEYLLIYKKRMEELELLKKYKNNKCNNEEIIEVLKITQKTITELMIDKLSKDELIEAKHKINVLNQNSDHEIIKKIDDNYSHIEELNMIDAYVLHIMYDVYTTKNLSRFIHQTKK